MRKSNDNIKAANPALKGFFRVVCFCIIIMLTVQGDALSRIGMLPVYAAAIKINKSSAALIQGESVQLRISGTKKTIKWSTGNKNIAVVSKTGKVTGKAVGTVNVTAAVGGKKYTCKITVKKKLPSVKSLKFQTEEVVLYPQDDFQLQLQVQPVNGDTKGFVYLSDNSGVAGVTTKGKIVAHGIGDTIIYAQDKKGKRCSVKVKVLTVPVLEVKGKTISLGDSEDTVMKTFGYPDRADLSVYGGKVYIYNKVRSELVMIFINENKVSGYFTDAMQFTSVGITPDTALEAIPYYFVPDKEAEWIRTYDAKGKYKAHILMDALGTKVIRGIYVLEDGLNMIDTGNALRGQELEFYDVAVSIRSKRGITMMNWSEAAAGAARMHGIDMIIKNYVSSGNFEGKSSGDRLRDMGVQCSLSGENILISHEDAIFAAYRTLNIYEHRINLMNAYWTHLGVGVSVNQGGKLYYVQEYFK